MKKLTGNKRDKQRVFNDIGKTKSRNQLLHLIRRFQERHNINLSAYDIECIKEQVFSNEAIFVQSGSNGAKLFKVNIRDTDIIVVARQYKENKIRKIELLTTYVYDKKYKDILENKNINKNKNKNINKNTTRIEVLNSNSVVEVNKKKDGLNWKDILSFFMNIFQNLFKK